MGAHGKKWEFVAYYYFCCICVSEWCDALCTILIHTGWNYGTCFNSTKKATCLWGMLQKLDTRDFMCFMMIERWGKVTIVGPLPKIVRHAIEEEWACRYFLLKLMLQILQIERVYFIRFVELIVTSNVVLKFSLTFSRVWICRIGLLWFSQELMKQCYMGWPNYNSSTPYAHHCPIRQPQ
jgi:hypothetical protein